jgi:hypothetical protein
MEKVAIVERKLTPKRATTSYHRNYPVRTIAIKILLMMGPSFVLVKAS